MYGHAETASVDDVKFNDYWRDIRDTLIRLGGVGYKAAIDDLRNECMDPEVQDHYRELLSQWKKDEENIKEELGEIKKILHVLARASSKEATDQGNSVLQIVKTRITTAFSTCHATNFSVASCDNMLRKVDPSSIFCNRFFQLATLKFERAVVIRATTLFNLQWNNVARQVERKCCPITSPLTEWHQFSVSAPGDTVELY